MDFSIKGVLLNHPIFEDLTIIINASIIIEENSIIKSCQDIVFFLRKTALKTIPKTRSKSPIVPKRQPVENLNHNKDKSDNKRP